MSGTTNKWRIAFFVVLGVTIPSLGYLAYLVMDVAVTHSYMKDGYDATTRDLSALGVIFPKDRYKKKDIASLLRQQHPGALIVETGCSVQMDGLLFYFDENERMVDIETRAEYAQHRECASTR